MHCVYTPIMYLPLIWRRLLVFPRSYDRHRRFLKKLTSNEVKAESDERGMFFSKMVLLLEQPFA